MTGHIDESNWGLFAAVVLEAEASHWEAEYEALARKYGTGGARKAQAAWKLGATMLRRRAEIYRNDYQEPGVRLTVVDETRAAGDHPRASR